MGKENTLKQLLKQVTSAELQQELKDRGIQVKVKEQASNDVLLMALRFIVCLFVLTGWACIVAVALKNLVFSGFLLW